VTDFDEPLKWPSLRGRGQGVRTSPRSPNSRLSKILAELERDDDAVGDRALESLAKYFADRLGLQFREQRRRRLNGRRSTLSGVGETAQLYFSRWHICCQHTDELTLSELATEVGHAVLERASIVMIVTTGTATTEAIKYADAVTADSTFQIVILDRDDLAQLAAGSLAISRKFDERARHTKDLKRLVSI
jgi:hypothetical protein